MAVKTITSENFEAEVLNAKEPVLVDIWAPWCGPCKMLSPIVDEVAEEAVGFSVAKINADENPELVNKFHVMSIPTLLVFKNGELVNKSVGLISKDEIKGLKDKDHIVYSYLNIGSIENFRNYFNEYKSLILSNYEETDKKQNFI